MSQHTITLDKERGKQIIAAREKRADLSELSNDDIVKKLFFEKLDEVTKPYMV